MGEQCLVRMEDDFGLCWLSEVHAIGVLHFRYLARGSGESNILCTLFCLQHSAFQALPIFVFQTACIRTQSLILFTMFYVCRKHL
jgi:hypothetical protein